MKTAVERCTQQAEKVEQVTRSKTTSIYEEVGLLKGQGSQLHKDGHGLMKSLEKKMEHQSAVIDGLDRPGSFGGTNGGRLWTRLAWIRRSRRVSWKAIWASFARRKMSCFS